MPRSNLTINSTIQVRKKTTSIVKSAITSSVENDHHGRPWDDSCGYTARPSAWRMRVSSCSKAATMAADDGVEDSTESSVVDVGIGEGICVARNMW